MVKQNRLTFPSPSDSTHTNQHHHFSETPTCPTSALKNPDMKILFCILICLSLSCALTSAENVDSIRIQEINQCLSGEIVTWGDGKDRPVKASPLIFTYDSMGAPNRFSDLLVTGMISKAVSAWSQCGVNGLFYKWGSPKAMQRDVIIIKWSEKDSSGNFGLSNLSKLTLSLGPKAFDLLNSRNPSFDARETLQLVISHEIGHFFGLMAHSRRCIDVLSYYNNGKGESALAEIQLRWVP